MMEERRFAHTIGAGQLIGYEGDLNAHLPNDIVR